MIKELWINLPVKNIEQSRAFFSKLGFEPVKRMENAKDMTGFYAGDRKVVVMLVIEPLFKSFTQNNTGDWNQATEVLFSIDAASREEVDEMANKAKDAGGNVFATPAESQGWLYGCGFADLDGHRWNILYRDMSKMPG